MTFFHPKILFCIGVGAWLTATFAAAQEGYAVRVTATVQAAPPQITLQWPESPAAANYTVARKSAGAGAWGSAVTLPGTATSFVDTQVSTGTLYEYQVIKREGNVTGYGYLTTGIEAPLADLRGRVVLVVDQSIAGVLSSELQTLQEDLAGDGWTVTRLDVDRSATPASVREQIRATYNADPANTRAVLLFGHVPVVKSGNLNVDGHGGRPLPADVYYGDMDGAWSDANGDGVLDPSVLPSDVELQVGRVDFADMPVGGAPEAVLLQQYVFKNHDFRHAVRRPAQRALIGDRFGPFEGQAHAATAYRAFPALVGNNNIELADTADNAPASQRWMARLAATDYLWVFGAGAGGNSAIGSLGSHGQFGEAQSQDFIQQRAKGTFYLLFGSWFLDWSQPDNLMRAALAAPDYGLTVAWSGRPHLFLHPVAMGETIGSAIRLSQNNSSLYTNQVNLHTRGIHIALLGDPTLRQNIVAPPQSLSAQSANGVTLNWSASRDSVIGYHVYRGANRSGPFTRLTSSPVNATTFTDSTAPAGTHTFLVRAVQLTVTPAGSFFNASQGVFAEATSAATAPAPAPAPAPTPSPSPTPTPAPAPSPSTSPVGGSGGGGGAISPLALGGLAMMLIARLTHRRRQSQ